ncbi:MAG TPA: MFS transporter [Planctomycetota bacterium]|nr:MFS transporter [Planctomycetota bacterium]
MTDAVDPGGPAGPAPGSADPALGERNFVLYLIARFVASLGQQMLTVAVGWELYEQTNSALSLGLVGLTNIAPMFLFTLPAGHLADSRDRKRIMVSMTGVIALASAALTCVSALRAPTACIYVCLFAVATARTFLWPASASFLPQLVARASFPRAVAWSTGSFHLSSVAGPAAGGALIALLGHAAVVYAVNAVAALLCLTLLCLLRHRRQGTVREPMSLQSLVAGFRFVFASRVILGIITLDLFAVLLGGATALLPVYAKDILRVGPGQLGLLQAALPVGALLSAMVLARRRPMARAGRALLWSVIGFGLCTVGFGFSTCFWLSWGMLFLCGATDNVSVVVRQTLVQLLTPDEKRGRVSAVNSLFIGTSNELGGFESGVVAHWLGPVFAVVSGGVGTVLVVVMVALVWPEIRRYGRLDGD